MSLFTRIMRQAGPSATIAKERLQLMVVHDRMSIPPATLDALKNDILLAISNHVAIDRANVEVQVARTNEGNRLMMNIPVLGVHTAATKPRARRLRTRKQ